MWSHYGHDHRGYCLEFKATNNTPVFGRAQPVVYADDYPVVDYYNTPKLQTPQRKLKEVMRRGRGYSADIRTDILAHRVENPR